MFSRPRTWYLISASCLLAALILWLLVGRNPPSNRAVPPGATVAPTALTPGTAASATATNAAPASTPLSRTNAAAALTNAFPYRLSNTTRTLDELMRTEPALLLRNALIDSSIPINLPVPAHLRATGDPGSYVVQSKGPLTDAYRALLRQAGAEVVAYVPNNAYLVRASAAAAQQLATSPQTQAVLPWEPYYKLDAALLPLAVDQKPLPPNAQVVLLLFPGQRELALTQLAALDAVVVGEDRSPFGPLLRVRPSSDSLVALANLPAVQELELHHRRAVLNDLGRQRVLVSTNTVTAFNYLGLDGTGILVNVNDTGVEAAHPDLEGRVTGDGPNTILDSEGHGTHVAGTIASSGASGPKGPVPGSVTNANFRGMAPQASIYALPINTLRGTDTPDSYLQETPALTNALISNNSWSYPGSHAYTVSSASWDAAVRDALPGVTGPQPLLAVFSAGNSGVAGIDAPANAKNVITVGAIKNMRDITNEVTVAGVTNQPWLGLTDTNNEIAPFTAIGNVGRGQEGAQGRFKPDLVAPGTFVVSTRSSHWVQPTNNVSFISDVIEFIRLRPGESKPFEVFAPDNAVRLQINTLTNDLTGSTVLPPLPIYVKAIVAPVPPADLLGTNSVTVDPLDPVPEIWHWIIENPGQTEVRFNVQYIISVTNDVGNEPEIFFGLNSALGRYYRYETGTSMSAPAVSGVLALMQQHYERQLGLTNSPALMKALLINGARSVNDSYDFNTDSILNGQGWGLVALTNSIAAAETVEPDGVLRSGTMVFYDQHVKRALATGQSFTRVVNVASNANSRPLRFTLVWTDPPGNPAVGLKLVNDLDLIVTNLDTREVYVGNAIGAGNIWSDAAGTNSPLAFDRVNNVENIYLLANFRQRLSSRYSVTVRARRVNVNAVTADNTGTVQDFALVLTSGEPRNAAALQVQDQAVTLNPAPEVSVVTNGIPLLNQRVGAQFPFNPSSNGIPNQWHFFVVTNRLPPSDPLFGNASAATNIAFATFLPPNLSRPRQAEADIDLYVTRDPAITNLVPSVLDAALRSRKRTGTESVVIEGLAAGAVPGALFYAAVKSEDQQAANFGFFAISSSFPFSKRDTNGNTVFNGYPINVPIPDGSPDQPQAAFMFAFCTSPDVIQNVTVTNILTHESGGDLFGALSHDLKNSVLNANRSFSNSVEFIYDDSDSGLFGFDTTTDAPGSLRNFVGEEAIGAWRLTMVDSTPGFTGVVNRLSIKVEPRKDDLTNGVGIVRTIPPGHFFYTVVDVPADATNLAVCVSPDTGPVEVYIARGSFPDRTSYDTFGIVAPPGDCVNLGLRDSPPLSQGRYFIGVFNPNPTPVTVNIKVFIQLNLDRRSSFRFGGSGAVPLLDDAITNGVIHVSQDRIVSDVEVGVRIDHSRVADLVLHLVSPSGKRILLAENRGGPDWANYGFGALQTNVAPASSSGGPAANTNLIGGVQPEGTIQVDYNFFSIPDRMTVYYEGQQIFDSGLINGQGTFSVDYGPGLATNVVIVMNEGDNPNFFTAWDYTATVFSGYTYATFTEHTNLAPVPIKFAPPPFTNFNYSAVTVITNGVILDDSFESPPQRHVPVDEIFSGWKVEYEDVKVIATTPGFMFADSGDYFIDINGLFPSAIFTNVPTTLGQEYQVSFAWARNTNNPGTVSADVRIDGGTKISVAAPPGVATNWIHTNFIFSAASAASRLEVVSTTFDTGDDGSGVFFDSFRIESITEKTNRAIYFQPEEALTPLFGENSFGDWKLEIWDTRLGGGLTNVLLAWKLNLTFINTNVAAIPLTNGIQKCLTLSSNDTVFFRVDVPINASSATNFITGTDNLDFMFNQLGEPIGTDPPDTFFLRNQPGGTGIMGIIGWNSYDLAGNFLDAGFAPTIEPGKRYYLAVRNRGSSTNDVCVRVSFDQITPNLIGIVALTNRCFDHLATTTTNAGSITYYSFDASSLALGVQFSISNIAPADVDLVARRGLPLPTATSFSQASTNNFPDGEFIEVDDFFGTELPGRWYLGVINRSGAAINYTICADEIPGVVTPIVTNRLYTGFQIASNSVQYYRVEISSNAYLADFIVTNRAGGNVDLYISTNTMTPLFGVPTNALYGSTLAAPQTDIVELTAFTPNLLTPGTWFIAVASGAAGPVTYDLMVRELTVDLPYVALTNGVFYSDTITAVVATNLTTFTNQPGSLGLYKFDVSPNALQAVFEIFGMDQDVDLYVRYGAPLPPPGTNLFTYASANTGLTNEFMVLLRNGPLFLRPGTWYLRAIPKLAGVPASFNIRATEILPSDVFNLVNGVEVCRTIPTIDTNALYTGVQFYALTVPPGAVEATFELVPRTNDVDMYIQRGLPLTNFTAYPRPGAPYPYPSEAPGLAPEFRCLRPSSVPEPLSPGTWYVSVVNRSATNADYCLRASWLAPENLTRLQSGVEQCALARSPDGGPIVGIDYYVLNVATNAISATFETLQANGNVDMFVTRDLCLTNFAAWDASLTNYPYASTNLGTNSEFICIATNSQPVPLSGGNWYLAVVNREPTNRPVYCVRATQYFTTNVVCITNSDVVCTVLEATNGSASAGIDYYSITIDTNVTVALFETFNATGDVDLYVSDSGAITNVTNPALGPDAYLYSSTNPGPASECVTVSTNTAPVALHPGTWYATVINRSRTPVSYCFRATQFTNLHFLVLSNSVAGDCGQTVPPTNSDGTVGVTYFAFTVRSNVLRMTFDVFNASGNVDLYVQKGLCFQNRGSFPVGLPNAPYESINPGTNAESICVDRSSQPLPLSDGEWFMAVVSREGADTTFCVRGTEYLDTTAVRLTNRLAYVPPAPVAPATVDWYRYQVSADAVQVNVEILQPDGNVDLYLEPGFCETNVLGFAYASTNGGTTNELIRVATNSAPVPLSPRDWRIGVLNRDTNNVHYTVRVTEVLASQIIRLTNGVPYTNTVVEVGSVTDFPVQYYVYDVTTNAMRAQFEILATTGDVNLYARHLIPLPAVGSADYHSANGGASLELITLLPSSLPVPLVVGDWFLAAVNPTTNAVTYVVQATEFSVSGTNPTVASVILATTNTLCITWTGVVPGLDYYVVGRPSFSTPIWLPVSGTLRTTNNFLSWCTSLPTPYTFFDLRQGLSPLSLNNPITFTNAAPATNGLGIVLCWTAPPNQLYAVYYTDTLAPPYWQPYPAYITSTNNAYKFIDDGTKTGSLNVNRFYRVVLLTPP